MGLIIIESVMFSSFIDLLIPKDSLNNYFHSIYVITLPKRVQYIKETFKVMNIGYIQFDAIQGNTLNKQDLIKLGKLSPNNKMKTINEIACSLSHLSIIQNFINNANDNSTILIFEDDIIQDTTHLEKVKNVMKNIPSDWDFLNFSRCWDNCGKDKKINNYVVKSERALCGSAYALTKKGALKILKYAYPIFDPIDIYFVSLQYNKIDPLIFYSSFPRIYNQMKSISSSKSSTSPKLIGSLTSSLGNFDDCLECSGKYTAPPKFTRI